MPFHYLKIALRKLQREKLYALINISGLAIAIAFLTLALQSFSTARSNPVEALRYE